MSALRVFAFLAVLALTGCGGCLAPLADGLPSGETCSKCHGSADNAAPPQAVVKGKTTADVEVGAHQRHLRGGFAKRVVRCEECHLVPETPEAPGHIDLATPQSPSTPADVTFGGLATLGVTPSWNREPATCSNYCHGATLSGGTRTVPTWTFAEEPDYLSVLTARSCGGCHGAPPPPPHPARTECELCHSTTVSAAFDIVPGGTHLDGKLDVSITGCGSCHGSALNPAPPADLRGNRDPTERTVGAHQAHLTDSAIRKAVGCAECHLVPAVLDAPGHVDSALPAELSFGPLATHDGGVTPGFDGLGCTNYCHGATLSGGGATTPVWTRVDGTQKQCGSCHGAPPPPPHSPSTACGSCHPATVFPDGGIDVEGGHHLDGVLDVGTACHTCHGSVLNPAPPRDLTGGSDTSAPGVGAHQAHLTDSLIRKAVGCPECHQVPAAVDAPGHLDSALPAELTFGPLATHDGGVSPGFDGAGCTNYCHGATLSGGAATTPAWTQVDGTQKQCGSCHGAPPPLPHTQSAACWACHPATVFADGGIDVDGGRHLDGVLDVATACNSCHGSANPAPPHDLSGLTVTTARGVGAHQSHLADSPLRRAVGCAECHLVPAAVNAPGHLDSALPAELSFGPLATHDGGVTPAFDGLGCTNYCHGATLSGGGATTPVWTRVDGTQKQCGSCHGAPPPLPHPASSSCDRCHPLTVFADGGIDVDGGHHLDGVLDVASACNSCHGSAGSSAPPQDLSGASASTALGVGAHQAHLAPSTWRNNAIGCEDCHRLPATVGAAGHLDTALPAELTWSALASGDGGSPTWNPSTATCTNYCHGERTRGGTNKTPVWTQVDGTQAACGTCHGAPPPNHYGASCELCHPTMGPGLTIILPARHLDGVVDINGGGACGGCHAVPPQTGAHAAHYGDLSATPLASYGDERQLSDYFDAGRPYYMFGCGTCHPVAPAMHLNGTVEVDLVSTDGGVFKARNGPGATWNAGPKTCTNVYCHSSGQQEPAYQTSPGWNSATFMQCDGCHGNPPAYPSGDAGSPTANVHLVMADDGYEFGHFGGLPGPWHTSFHGNRGAGAMTCQACHYATTDPTHTGPSGFYWLNTTGNYKLDGGSLNYACTGCHSPDAGTVSPPGAGGVVPLKHVNGVRDVVFDRRMLLPAGYTGGVTPAPTAPFWVRASSGMKNYDLANAGYDPLTKTCTSVSCHRAQTSVQWGLNPVGWATCNSCHQY